MITKSKFAHLKENDLIASVRVVPVPLTNYWCVDAIVRTPMEAGSSTKTVAAAPTDNPEQDKLRKFESIDETALFLQEIGITSFTVDTTDSFSYVSDEDQAVKMVETTVRLWEGE